VKSKSKNADPNSSTMSNNNTSNNSNTNNNSISGYTTLADNHLQTRTTLNQTKKTMLLGKTVSTAVAPATMFQKMKGLNNADLIEQVICIE
jgi:hypothetical protein